MMCQTWDSTKILQKNNCHTLIVFILNINILISKLLKYQVVFILVIRF
jgi:hypothetical protein